MRYKRGLMQFLVSASLLSTVFALGTFGQKISPRPETKPRDLVPLDLNAYKGWQKIEKDWFSFYAPADLKAVKINGIDSTVYQYKSADLSIGLDIGMYNVNIQEGSERSDMIVDGQNALVWYLDGSKTTDQRSISGLTITFGEATHRSYFSMFLSSKRPDFRSTANKVFASLRFKLNEKDKL